MSKKRWAAMTEEERKTAMEKARAERQRKQSKKVARNTCRANLLVQN